MAFRKPEPKAAIDPDREKIPFKVGTAFEGTVVRISDRKPSNFGGEVRYIDVDTTDGRKIAFGVSKFKLEMFEDLRYQPGDGIRVNVEERETTDGQRKYADPGFEIDERGPRRDSQAGKPQTSTVDDNPPF